MGYFRIVTTIIFLVATGQSNDEELKQVFDHSHSLTAIQPAHQDNMWWRLLNFTAVNEGYTECYVCANSPLSTDKPFRDQPVSVQENEFKCLMWLQAITNYLPKVPCSTLLSNISRKLITLGIDVDVFKECASSCESIHSSDFVPAKAHDKARDDTMPKAIQVYVKPKFMAPVCVCQNSGIKNKWIGHSRCAERYVNNNSYWGPTNSSGNMWSMTKSMSYILITNHGFENVSVYPDSIIPTSQERYGSLKNKFWICGNNAYSWLPPQWSGCCYIGYLSTSLTFIPPNDQIVNKKLTRQKRGTHNTPRIRISSNWKTVGGIFPWYGTVQNAHVIDNISMQLESFANYAIKGFHLLNDQMKSVRLVALQNRAALDYLLAKDGGVCALIGDQCCTYIPDIDHNMTDVIEHMTQLRDEIENSSEPSTDTDFFSWVGNMIGKSLWNRLKDLGACFALIIGTILLLYFFVRITICICTTVFKEHGFYSPAFNKKDNVYQDIS